MSKKNLNGAEVVVECLKRQGVEYIFAYPGGAAIPIFDALVDSDIQLVLTRHEQGATHMADGYARATGKPGVVLVTLWTWCYQYLDGNLHFSDGFCSCDCSLWTDHQPMLGKDAFQECDISGMSFPCVKHSYLVKDVDTIPTVMTESFHVATTGRPGPVLIDLPKDVTSANCEAPFTDEIDLPGYHIPGKGEPEAISKAAELIAKSKRPLILAGHGASISGAHKNVLALANKLQAPVTNTLLGLGSFPGSHDLSLGMLGMHGTAYANKAVEGCDLIFSIGSRWDDRITGKLAEFCPDATKIHIDIDKAEFNKIIQPDVCIHGDAKLILDDLIPQVSKLDSDDWIKQIETWKKKYPLKYKKQGGLKCSTSLMNFTI